MVLSFQAHKGIMPWRIECLLRNTFGAWHEVLVVGA